MARAKRNEIVRYSDRARIAQYMHEGIINPQDIADRVNQGRPASDQVSRQTIRNDIEWLKTQWKESALYDFEAAKNQIMNELNHLKKKAWEELHKSERPKTTTTTEAASNGTDFESILSGEDQPEGASVTVGRTITREEEREGNVAYMQLIERIIERQCKILGIDAPNKLALVDSKGNDVTSTREAVLAATEKMGQTLTEQATLDAQKQKEEEEDNEHGPE